MTNEVQDLADQAEAAEQRFRDAALAAHAKRAQSTKLLPCGRCLYCNEGVAPGALFCRPDPGGSCAADWEHEQAAKRRNGNS